MKKKPRITAILMSIMMIFAIAPLASAPAFAVDDNGTTGTEKTIILDPGTAKGDPITLKSTDEGALAESEAAAAPGQFFLNEDVMCFKLPDPTGTFTAPAGVDFKGWIPFHMIQQKPNVDKVIGFGQGIDSLTLTAVWGPEGVNVNPNDNLVFSFDNENLIATIVGYGTTDLDPFISIPYSVNQGGDTPQCTITGIGDYAFQYLQPMFASNFPLIIPSGVRFIGDYAFYYTHCFNSIVFDSSKGESQLERIGNYAFANCGECTSVEIPASVKTIGEGAFANCDKLESAVYQGTKEQWAKVSVGSGNEDLTNVLKFKYTTIAKAANTLKIKPKTATVKGSTKGRKGKLKKTKTLAVTKVITFTNKGQGKLTYTKASGNKKITISKTTGKVTVKKGLKKGTYKVTVKVKAAGNANYNASAVKSVTFKVRVK